MIKNIVIAALVLIVGAFLFIDFAPKATVVPEIRPTNSSDRPFKDGNCYIQTDSVGNKIRVCG